MEFSTPTTASQIQPVWMARREDEELGDETAKWRHPRQRQERHQ